MKLSFCVWLILLQAAIARLEALENDNGALEVVDLNDDEEASLDEEDDLGQLSYYQLLSLCKVFQFVIMIMFFFVAGYLQKKQPKGSKRKTRQAKALEARKAPKSFTDLLQEVNVVIN